MLSPAGSAKPAELPYSDRTYSIRVGLLTPTGKDAVVTRGILQRSGIESRICTGMGHACRLIDADEIGVLVVAEEALGTRNQEELFAALERQPSWSDLPIIVLTGEDELSESLPRALGKMTEKGNVTLIERPVRVTTLTTLIRSAQRARHRQLDVRDYIRKRDEAEQSLRQSEQRLQNAVLSAPYPLILHAEDGQILQLSRAWTELSGYEASSNSTSGEWSRLALQENAGVLEDFDDTAATDGVSVHLGERPVLTANGTTRTWDFHRVALGRLPDGRRINLTAAIDVTEYKHLVQSERDARMQAEEANSAKSRFLATMSHELRTPLNAIAGYAQLLTLGLRGPVTPEQLEDLGRIDRSQRHLLSLINDILNFARIEAGHVAIESGPVDLVAVLASLTEFVEPQLREKNLNFEIRNECGDAIARGDEDKIRQILINLLSNAIKFTELNGSITVRCSATRDTVQVIVTDDGGGIPADKLDAIFEPFVQVGRDFASTLGGTGLGLSISRDLARRMEGDIEVTSELGQGSIFKLILPKN